MYIFYLFDFFLFSVLEKREKIWHWDKAGFSSDALADRINDGEKKILDNDFQNYRSPSQR
jgi:hypothetical protein